LLLTTKLSAIIAALGASLRWDRATVVIQTRTQITNLGALVYVIRHSIAVCVNDTRIRRWIGTAIIRHAVAFITARRTFIRMIKNAVPITIKERTALLIHT
jgi:hypothetical protein